MKTEAVVGLVDIVSFVGLIIYDILYKVPVLGLYFYTKMIKYWGTINIFDQTNINFIISRTQVNKKTIVNIHYFKR